jgi:LacI family transcriptional regulator
MKQANLPTMVNEGADDPLQVQNQVIEMLHRDPRPTAFFAANTLVMHAVMQAARRAGLRVPDDVALVGFEDFRWAGFVKPALTVIRQPGEEMGRRAAQILFERLAGKQGLPQTLMLETELVIRESCGCGAEAQLAAQPHESRSVYWGT